MAAKYCYWSVATGPYAAWMERCAASARAAGVAKEFHVLADCEVPGCECYDAMGVDLHDGMFKFIYLQAAISKLNFDYYVWVDADTLFTRNPDRLLAALCASPIHAPLEALADGMEGSPLLRRLSPVRYRELMHKAGVYNEVYASRPAFWIIKRAAVDVACELAQHYYAVAKKAGETPHGDAALSYTMQMLCGDPQAHLASMRPDLWWSDEVGTFQEPLTSGWNPRQPLAPRKEPRPSALLHLPARRRQAMAAGTCQTAASVETGCA